MSYVPAPYPATLGQVDNGEDEDNGEVWPPPTRPPTLDPGWMWNGWMWVMQEDVLMRTGITQPIYTLPTEERVGMTLQERMVIETEAEAARVLLEAAELEAWTRRQAEMAAAERRAAEILREQQEAEEAARRARETADVEALAAAERRAAALLELEERERLQRESDAEAARRAAERREAERIAAEAAEAEARIAAAAEEAAQLAEAERQAALREQPPPPDRRQGWRWDGTQWLYEPIQYVDQPVNGAPRYGPDRPPFLTRTLPVSTTAAPAGPGMGWLLPAALAAAAFLL